jgi:phospholipase/carboxylesterase
MTTEPPRAHLDQWPHVYRDGIGPVIVTLHGYGGNEVEVSGLAEWLNPSRPVLSPRGTIDEQGTYRWYGRFTGQQFDPVDIHERADELMGFLGHRAERYGFTLSEALVSGFSNGGAMAAALGVLYPAEIRQVAVFSGVLPFHTLPNTDLTGLRVWSSHGNTDMWVSEEAGQNLVTSLESLGATVGSLVRPGGHGITGEEVQGAKEFFAESGSS